jgi:hypothetical protein
LRFLGSYITLKQDATPFKTPANNLVAFSLHLVLFEATQPLQLTSEQSNASEKTKANPLYEEENHAAWHGTMKQDLI